MRILQGLLILKSTKIFTQLLRALMIRKMNTLSVPAKPNTQSSVLKPPDGVRGMKTLDREAFNKTIEINTIAIPKVNLVAALKLLKPYMLKIPKIKPVNECTVLLNPDIVKDFECLDENLRKKLSSDFDVTSNNFGTVTLQLGYRSFHADEIFKAILPTHAGFSGYSCIGHIIHVNLRDHLLAYKNVIGQVLLDKNKRITTVINKIDMIESEYRNFAMEFLAGEENTIVSLKQSGSLFEFDFAKVYWNPRLSTEHERITALLNQGDILYDVFAGIGPFVIPAAKKNCDVLANDLNPDSVTWLKRNLMLNKVSERVKVFNMDGKDFIAKVVKDDILERINTNGFANDHSKKVHITMNLPAIAVSFLVAFKGLFADCESLYEKISELDLTVHCYSFVREVDLKKCAVEMIENELSMKLDWETIQVFNVRHVAPSKDMVRASFKLPLELLYSKGQNNNVAYKEECPSKRRKEN